MSLPVTVGGKRLADLVFERQHRPSIDRSTLTGNVHRFPSSTQSFCDYMSSFIVAPFSEHWLSRPVAVFSNVLRAILDYSFGNIAVNSNLASPVEPPYIEIPTVHSYGMSHFRYYAAISGLVTLCGCFSPTGAGAWV